MKKIIEDEFRKYEECRLSGLTNMFDINTVKFMTTLDKETIVTIMENYTALKKKFGDIDE